MRLTKTFLAIIVVAFAATSAQAAVLVNYQNDALVAGATSAPTQFVQADLSSTALTLPVTFPASNWPDALTAVQNNAGINSLAAAISGGDYFTFTVTSDAGQEASYSSLFLRYALGANVFPAETTFTLTSGLTGFTSSDGLGNVVGALPAATSGTGTGTFDLTGVTALQDIAAETAVEFRIYAYNTGTNPMTRIGIGHAFATNGTPDLTLNGTVAPVPEPSAIALLGLGVIGLVARRRRRTT